MWRLRGFDGGYSVPSRNCPSRKCHIFLTTNPMSIEIHKIAALMLFCATALEIGHLDGMGLR
jgi:hypothetical protein